MFWMSSAFLTVSGTLYEALHTLIPDTVLLANLRILGRAPGFRLWDVDAALRTAIHKRPFT